VLTATVGLAACFFFNAASYVAVIFALLAIRPAELTPAPRSTQPGQLRQGLSYVRHTPVLFVSLLLMGVVGTLAYEFPVTLPILAERSFDNEDLYGPMSALQGVGAVVGALWVAARFTLRTPAVLSVVAAALGVLIVAVAYSPTLPIAFVFIVLMGGASIAFIAIGNTVLQLEADPAMRGRVMSLWSIALIGSTTIGGPFVGWVADELGARSGLAVGGLAAIIGGIATYPSLRRLGNAAPPGDAGGSAEPLPQEQRVGGILPSPPS
jgi:predicted MFS family arabinose efflux permease